MNNHLKIHALLHTVMRITFIQALLAMVFAGVTMAHSGASQSLANQQISLQVQNQELKKVLHLIEKEANVKFVFSSKIINTSRKISVNANKMALNEVLDNLLLPLQLSYEYSGKVIILKRKRNTSAVPDLPVNESQVRSITGKITSSEGSELPGVTVLVKGTSVGTASDAQGNYQINLPEGSNILVFSYIGFVTQEVPVGDRSVVDVKLTSDAKALGEVVVIGYGTRSQRDVTTAISTVKPAIIEKSLSMNPVMAMQGTMSGVQITGNSGNINRPPTVRIRGINTWGNASPLYVVDGIPLTDPNMNLIDPNDIESISVLKDASAGAIYGVRASNGVILVTTKKGRSGKPTVEISSRYGIQNMNEELDLLDAQQYVKHIQDVWASDPTLPRAPLDIVAFDPSSPGYLGNSPTYNWQKAMANKNAPIQDHSARISGGSEKSDYFLSLGYSGTEGTLIGSRLERLSGSFKLNTQVNNWFRLGVNYRLVSSEGENNQSGENLWRYSELMHTPPVQPIYGDGPGGYAPVVVGLQEDGTYNASRLYGQGTRRNFAGLLASNDSRNSSLRQLGGGYLEIEPVRNLRIKGSISVDANKFTDYNFYDYATSVFSYDASDPRAFGGGNSVGSYREWSNSNYNYIKEITVNYANSFGDHNIDLLFSGMDQQYGGRFLNASTEYMTTKLDYLRGIGGENRYTIANGGPTGRHALQGLLGRIGYNYKNKYYLDVVTRRDGSARFAPENRWGTFPSFSAAWRISGENFMTDLTWLKDLKLRAGWGKLGNQEVRNMAYLLPISTAPTFAWGNDPANPGLGYYSTAAAVYSLANRNLQWEKTETTNIGLDAEIFNGLNMSVEYYNKITKGILQDVSLPNSAGVREQPSDNIASVGNSGVELSLNYAGRVRDFQFNIGGNFTTVKNVVKSTYKNIPLWGDRNIETGYSLFYLRGYKVGGIFQTQEELDAWKQQYTDVNYQTAKVAPGDVYFQDLRSAPDKPGTFYKDSLDNKIDNNDQVFLGKTIPGFFYGFNSQVAWKGFDLYAQFTGVGDVSKINQVRASFENSSSTTNNLSTNIFNAWTPENKSTTMPRLIGGDPARNFRGSDMYLESGAYFRLSNIQLGYTLPDQFYNLVKKSVNRVRIYAGASNVFTITKYTGFDPEDDDYPSPQVLTLGLDVRF